MRTRKTFTRTDKKLTEANDLTPEEFALLAWIDASLVQGTYNETYSVLTGTAIAVWPRGHATPVWPDTAITLEEDGEE